MLVLPYVVEADGAKFCVLKRADSGSWQFISGGGEDDETPLEAARRESFEEAGLPPTLNFVALDSRSSVPAYCFSARKVWGEDTIVVPEYAFAVRLPSREIALSDEHTTFEWLGYDEACARLKYDSNRTAMWEVCERLRLGLI